MHKAQMLRNWRARRAGGRITVYGETPLGEQRKVVGVDVITPHPTMGNACLATDKNGTQHTLYVHS